MLHTRRMVVFVCVAICCNFRLAAAEPLEIRDNITLEAGQTYGPLVILKSNITIDGNGAVIQGATEGKPKDFQGTGILADGVSGVTLKNVSVKGFETGLKLSNGEKWQIEECDFSDNFHDPDFGWGENGRRGGIVLYRVKKSRITNCKANHNWDACSLVESDENTLKDNDFSHCSNTCLKLWIASRNTIEDNDLSYGLRISPGEVHARDSTSVLIESGSNGNKFVSNDCTHGGDGIFVRVLNGWCSTENEFIGNDCSYANNNAVECWSPRNVFVSNKANHSSYGFWMGGSDKTELIDNEASYNGLKDGFHNSPHLPDDGHAGIVFMFGPSSHCVARGNKCEHNNGAGIAIIGDQASKGEKWKAYHWILERNELVANRWGVFLEYADWIDLGGNQFKENVLQEIHEGPMVTRLTKHTATPHDPDLDGILPELEALIRCPKSLVANEKGLFEAGINLSSFAARKHFDVYWDFGDASQSDRWDVEHSFAKAGFYRVGVTISCGTYLGLSFRDYYVIDDLPEPATEGNAEEWSFLQEPNLKISYKNVDLPVSNVLAGKQSVIATIDPYHGQRATMLYPKSKNAGWKLDGKKHLVFWFKANNSNIPGWQDVNPVVTIGETNDRVLKLTPKADLLSQSPYNEAREGWRYFEVPLAGDENWLAEGPAVETLNWLTIGIDSWGGDAIQLWLDGLAVR